MKNLILIGFALIAIRAFSQTDTIFTVAGEKLMVNVSEVNESAVKFMYPGESVLNTVGKGTISEIHFKSGRVEEYTTMVAIVRGAAEWEKVEIANLEFEVQGLTKIDNIGAKAKGVTTLSSLAKLQDRAYNKMKIQTAMLGGNVAYIIDQNTEDAIDGGEYGSSKSPSVTISGIAYTSRWISQKEIVPGSYMIENVLKLRANSYNMEREEIKLESFELAKEDFYFENDVPKINLKTVNLPNSKEFTVIYADDHEIVLSAVYSTHYGKKTYYNVYLKKI